jgi:Tol biopolymer transport system component
MPEYPTLRSPPARRTSSAGLWVGGLVALLALLALVTYLAMPQLFGLPAAVVAPSATLVAVEPTPSPTRPLPTPTRVSPSAAAETARGAATAEAEPTPEFGRGVQIVFTAGTPGCSKVGLMNLDEGNIRIFDPSPNNEEPTWSPDGRLFVASTGDCQNTQYGLTLFDAESGDTIPVPLECPMAIDPSWGEDDRIYFACGSRAGNGDLFSVNPDGSELRAIGISARRPTLSPDGKYLAYMRQEGEVWRIWVAELNAEGAAVNPTQMPFPQVLGGVYARQPRWNSDGTRLFFNVTDQTSLAAIALASVELATGSTNVSFITPDTNTPFVRPVCGKGNVCVASGANGGLWLLEDVSGSLIPKRQLTFGEEYGADVFP